MKLFKLLPKNYPRSQNRPAGRKSFFSLSFLFSGIGAGLILINWKSLPPELPLHYSRPWGEAQLASLSSFFLLPLIGTAIGLVNLVMAKTLFRQNIFLTRALEITSLTLNFLLLVTIVKIITIVL